jgi:hypothetical protein
LSSLLDQLKQFFPSIASDFLFLGGMATVLCDSIIALRCASSWLLCDSTVLMQLRCASCRECVAVWLELMNSIHHPSSSLCGFFAYVTTFARFASHVCKSWEFCSKRTCGRSKPLNDGCVVLMHKIQNIYYTMSKWENE